MVKSQKLRIHAGNRIEVSLKWEINQTLRIHAGSRMEVRLKYQISQT